MGDPGVSWRVVATAFSPRGRYVAVKSVNMDLALYEIGQLDAADSDSGVAELAPRVIREGGDWDKDESHREPGIGFASDESDVYAFSSRRFVMERWSTADPSQRTALTAYGKVGMIYPGGLTPDGAIAWNCSFHSMEMAHTSPPSMAPMRTYTVPVKYPEGGYSIRGGSLCAVSPDGRWAAMGLNNRSGDIKYDFSLSLWDIDGTPRLHDLGHAEDKVAPDRVLAAQVAGLTFSADSRYLVVADALAGVHIYALEGELRKAKVPAEKLHLKQMTLPLIATATDIVVIGDHGGHIVTWLPIEPAGAKP
ncbi:hypothetical protein [Tahibacter amnicola]|uniref:WD40 repeat protein n=1 Tax=Tahibacter amnicola TaxID=2976241 RepID=A0ABY6BMJ6_9GAMM|nr:hypothetical protein [Tahibacter amnicola]UXI69791.1 hypothetical protein N4264_09220 [Tahibacter amnicola]